MSCALFLVLCSFSRHLPRPAGSQPEADPAELLQLRSEAARRRREAAEFEERTLELGRKLEAAGEQVRKLFSMGKHGHSDLGSPFRWRSSRTPCAESARSGSSSRRS